MFDDCIDPIETGLRASAPEFIKDLIGGKLDAALAADTHADDKSLTAHSSFLLVIQCDGMPNERGSPDGPRRLCASRRDEVRSREFFALLGGAVASLAAWPQSHTLEAVLPMVSIINGRAPVSNGPWYCARSGFSQIWFIRVFRHPTNPDWERKRVFDLFGGRFFRGQ